VAPFLRSGERDVTPASSKPRHQANRKSRNLQVLQGGYGELKQAMDASLSKPKSNAGKTSSRKKRETGRVYPAVCRRRPERLQPSIRRLTGAGQSFQGVTTTKIAVEWQAMAVLSISWISSGAGPFVANHQCGRPDVDGSGEAKGHEVPGRVPGTTVFWNFSTAKQTFFTSPRQPVRLR